MYDAEAKDLEQLNCNTNKLAVFNSRNHRLHGSSAGSRQVKIRDTGDLQCMHFRV